MILLSTRRSVLTAILLLATPSLARADFFVTPFAGIKFGGSTSIVDLELAAGEKKLVLGVSAAMIDAGIIGYEVEFGNMADYFGNEEIASSTPLLKPGSYVNDLSANLLLLLPPGATRGGLRPYGVVGGGLIHAAAEDILELFQVRRTVPAITLGGGAIGLLTTNVGVRFDFRHLRSLSTDAPVGIVGRRISYSRFTVGLLLRL
jgi:hypothetical protein